MPRTNALFYADLLGVRSRWHDRGREGAEEAFRAFGALCASVIQDNDPGSLVDGGIESDAVALKCDSAETAVALAMDLYRRAFLRSEHETSERMWIRGAIVSTRDVDPLRTSRPLEQPYSRIIAYEYSGALLDAISAERSGIKGMRLLLDPALLSVELQDSVSVDFEGRRVERVLQLPYTPSPQRIADEGYYDLLWMAEPAQWPDLRETMTRRLQWSVKKSGDEFLQAAATQVIFDECADSIWGVLPGADPGEDEQAVAASSERTTSS